MNAFGLIWIENGFTADLIKVLNHFNFMLQQARMQKARPAQDDADAVWRYRFRQKWRREQLRALFDGPDRSLSGGEALPSDGSEDNGLMFGIDDIVESPLPAPPPPLQFTASAPAPRPAPALRLHIIKVTAGSDSGSDMTTPSPLAPPLPGAEALAAAFPELPAIRKAIMRGSNKPQHGKVGTADRNWSPRMTTSPQRAANAA